MSDLKYTIRYANLGDSSFIYQCVCQLEETTFDRSVFDKLFILNIQNPENVYLVAEENETAVGYVSCHGQYLLHHGGRVFEIQELFVLPDFRGSGIGRKLIHKLESIVCLREHSSLEVTANTKRKKTHGFYQSMGFEFTHYKFTKSGNKMPPIA